MRVSKTKILRETLAEELKFICDRVYFQNSSSKAKFPYIVYDLRLIQADFPNKYQLEVRIFDNSQTTYLVEELSDLLEKSICDTCIFNENHKLLVNLNVRSNPIDDKEYKICRLLFDVVYYGGSE